MPRSLPILLLAFVVALSGCTFEAGGGGYVFKRPGEDTHPAEETHPAEDTPVDTGPALGPACFDYFACVLGISTQGGSVDGCVDQAPEGLGPYLADLQACQTEHCNDLKYDPESGSFAPVAYRNCLKYSCSEALVGCFAHGENESGCKRYVICEQQCADTGVACDLGCMAKLAPEDIPSTVDYLNCMEEFAEFSEAGITEKLCDCLAICEVTYPICEAEGR
mgnify:CR=1 FL=1